MIQYENDTNLTFRAETLDEIEFKCLKQVCAVSQLRSTWTGQNHSVLRSSYRGLTWEDHVHQLCGELASEIFVLQNLAKHRYNIHVLKFVYYGLIYSHLNYGIVMWENSRYASNAKTVWLAKKAIHIISNLING